MPEMIVSALSSSRWTRKVKDQLSWFSMASLIWGLAFGSDYFRRMLAEADQNYAISAGLPGFFTRRLAVPWTTGSGAPELASIMDMRPLYHTLGSLCDFEELNRSLTPVS